MKTQDPKKLKHYLKLSKAGLKAYNNKDYKNALLHFEQLLDLDPKDLTYLNIVADCLSKLGVRDKAIAVIEYTLQHNQPDADMIMILGQLAMDFGVDEVAVKLYQIGIDLAPKNSLMYNNLATALGKMAKFDEAIDFLQSVIAIFPKDAPLWNTLAVQVQFRDGYEQAMVFFLEAVRLDPRLSSAWNNMAIATNNIEDGIEFSKKSLKVDPSNMEAMIGLAHMQLDQGYLDKGWENYDFRLAEFRRASSAQSMIYTHKLPRWKGEDLTGKSLLVCGEQGVGDEMFFGATVRELCQRAEKVYVGVNHRLIGLFQRAFPDAIVIGYKSVMHMGYIYRSFPDVEGPIKAGELTIDLHVPMASSSRYFWTDLDTMPVYENGYLHGAEDNQQKWKDRLAALPGKVNVGIAWRSGNMEASRTVQYAKEAEFAPILSVKGVNFINLQYGDVKEEINSFESNLGCKLHTWDDFDIKADIEANYALADNLDLIISPGITPGIIGMTAGAPTWMFAKRQCYFRMGAGDHVPMFPNCKVDVVDFYSTYESLFESYGKRLEEMVAAKS